MEIDELVNLCKKLGIIEYCEKGIKETIANMIGRKIRFGYIGENASYKCTIQTAHPPHVISEYQCGNRMCKEFCKGKSGRINENMEIMIIGEYEKGNVEKPDVFHGFYIILKT